MEEGVVFFVGGGPGDPRLLTLRGAQLLARATHVFADAELRDEVLAHAPPSAVVERVARADAGAHVRRMIAAAKAGGRVVRVVSGDPLLFRRGDEEIAAVRGADVRIEIVAGVTALTAAPAYGGLALTRGSDRSPSVAFVAVGDVSELHDWTKLSLATDTLCIVCDASHVDEITATLTYYGRSPHTPAAIIRDASLPSQRVATGTLADMRRDARGFAAGEVLLVVGESVALAGVLRWFDVRPLFGKRLLVTRPREQGEETAEAIRERGAEAVLIPAIVIEEPEDRGPLAAAVAALSTYACVAFTSANAVERVFAELGRQGRDARAFGAAKVAAVGPGTGKALEARGIVPDVVAKEHRGEGLAEALLAALPPGARVLLPRAEEAREVLPEALRAAGHTVDVVTAYVTRPVGPEGARRLRAALEERTVDAVLLTSSSSAASLVAALGDRAAELLARVVVASIGPITTSALERLGVAVDVTAAASTMPALLDALEGRFHAPRR
jgi:uroporphyrinogen III methyltransferase/synthase